MRCTGRVDRSGASWRAQHTFGARERQTAGRHAIAVRGIRARVAPAVHRLQRAARRPRLAHCSRPTPPVPHSSTKARVLVLAREAVIAALVGMLLELEDYVPVFPEPDERPDDAIRRLRPPLIVILDGSLPEARSDLFHARCAQAGARVCLFSEPVAAEAVRDEARERRAEFFSMPVERRDLGTVLARLCG